MTAFIANIILFLTPLSHFTFNITTSTKAQLLSLCGILLCVQLHDVAYGIASIKENQIGHSLKFIMFIIYMRLFTFYNIISNFNLLG